MFLTDGEPRPPFSTLNAASPSSRQENEQSPRTPEAIVLPKAQANGAITVPQNLATLSLLALFLGMVWLAGTKAGPRNSDLPLALLLHLGIALFALSVIANKWLQSRTAQRSLFLAQSLAALCVVPMTLFGASLLALVVGQHHRIVRDPYLFSLLTVVNLAVMWIMIDIYGLAFSSSLPFWALFVCFQGFAYTLITHADRTAQSRLRLAEVNAELMATRSLLMESTRNRERARISRELHDMTGHTITALRMNLRQLRSLDKKNNDIADECLSLSNELLSSIKNVVVGLRVGDQLHLHDALQQLAAPFDKPTFSFDLKADAIAPDVETARLITNVAREAITNVVRHANATQCKIELAFDPPWLHLTVDDNGHGLHGASPGAGMEGMIERVNSCGASIEWTTPPQSQGTRVSFRTLGRMT